MPTLKTSFSNDFDIERQLEMTAVTGNTYTSEAMTDNIEIPTANQRFAIAITNGQPEIAMRQNWLHCQVRLSVVVEVAGALSLSSPWSKTPDFPSEFPSCKYFVFFLCSRLSVGVEIV